MVEIETNWPQAHTAGLSFLHVLTCAAYPAPEWSLTAYVRGPSAFDLDGEAFGLQHKFVASADETALWLPGRYEWTVRATDGDQVVELDAGMMVVRPDLASAEAGHDPRDHRQRVLEAIEAQIEGRASADQKMYEIAGRRLERFPMADLLKLRKEYRAEVAREARRKAGTLFSGALKVRF